MPNVPRWGMCGNPWNARRRDGDGMVGGMTAAAATGGMVEVASASEPGPRRFGELPPCPYPIRQPVGALVWLLTICAGLASLLLLLAILAAIPVLNFLALGVMLEAEGRVVRSGRLRDGIPFAGALPRLGAVVIGVWLWLLVVRLVSQASVDAALVDPGGRAARNWALAQTAIMVFVGIHLTGALFAGGSLIAFCRPIRNVRRLASAVLDGTAWKTASVALAEAVDVIQPWRLFSLGVRGFVGAFLWLLVPTLLFSALRDTTKPVGVLVTLVGGVLLVIVLLWAPFLQARFAADPRMDVFRDLGAVRALWRRAPVAMLLAIVLLYGLSLPLPLLKIVATPRDAVILLTPVFILTIFPARLAVGWATHRAAAQATACWPILRWPVNAIALMLLIAYVFVLFFTPAIDARGRRVLFDHHALLLPTPL